MRPDAARIVQAVGVSASSRAGDAALAQRIEQAMAHAVADAIAEGVSLADTDAIRDRMSAARNGVTR